MSDATGFTLLVFLSVLVIFIGLVIFGFVFWTMLGFGSSEPARIVDEDEME